MPVQPNLLERFLFFGLNMAPAPILDLAGALSYQALATAARLGVFEALQHGPQTPAELAGRLESQERGIQALLQALEAIGYVQKKNGHFSNSPMTDKWLVGASMVDIASAAHYWSAAIQELWPHAPDVIQSGERPYRFYEWLEDRPTLARAFQRMMVTSAELTGADIAKKMALPADATRLLDVGGGHGMFSIILCQNNPNLRATIVDSPSALAEAGELIIQHGLADRINLVEGDMWQVDWGEGYDCILLFNLLHHFDLETNKRLLDMAAAALKPGGQVAILEQVEGEVSGAAASAFVRLTALQYYLFADGRVYSSDEIGDLLARAGFVSVRFHSLAKLPGNVLALATRTTFK